MYFPHNSKKYYQKLNIILLAWISNEWFIHNFILFLFADNITLSRLGSLMSLKDRPLPRTPTDFGTNNNFYSVPKHLHTAQTTPATSPNTTPWTTPKNSPRMDRRSISSETDGGSVSKGSSGINCYKGFMIFNSGSLRCIMLRQP